MDQTNSLMKLDGSQQTLGLKEEIEELEATLCNVVSEYYGEDVHDIQKMDSLTRGILTGRYDVTGYGIFPANTLTKLLQGGSATISAIREIARTCSISRYCIDTICKEIQSTQWEIRSNSGKKAPRNKSQQIIDFFMRPILDDEDYNFNPFMSRNVRDLMEVDWNLIEKVRNGNKKLIELEPLDAGLYNIVAKKVNGKLTNRVDYYMPNDRYMGMDTSGDNPDSQKRRIYPRDAISKMMYPRTGTLYGTPIIQSIIEEIGTIVFSTIHARKSFTDGEIPEGVLNLGKMSKADQERVEGKLIEGKGQSWKLKMLYGTSICEWVEFKRSHRDQELSEIRQHIERIIYRAFGFNTLDMGDEVSKGGAKEQRNTSRTRLIQPTLDLYKTSFDYIIHSDFNAPDLEFRWALEKVEDLESIGRAHDRFIRAGVETVNEARNSIGKDPLPGGDVPFIVVGNQAIPLTMIEETAKKNLEAKTKPIPNNGGNDNNNSEEQDNPQDDSEDNQSEDEKD